MTILNRFKVLLAEKEMREGRRITYSEIQKETGIAKSILSAWATNTVTLYDKRTIDRLCDYLDCSPGDLIIRVEDQN